LAPGAPELDEVVLYIATPRGVFLYGPAVLLEDLGRVASASVQWRGGRYVLLRLGELIPPGRVNDLIGYVPVA